MKNSENEERGYLWDRSGTPDPQVVRLEKLLGQLKHTGVPPRLPARQPRQPRTAWIAARLSAAAALLLLAALGWVALRSLTSGWTVQPISGTPVVDGVQTPATSAAARLRTGKWLETDAVSRARLAVGDIGRVDVEPNTRIQLVAASAGEQRLALNRGTIHARIWAPPRRFFVNTPSATAIDLGCEYTLHVDLSGAGLIHVTLGWVEFEGGGRSSLIPQDAVGATRPGVGPGTPYYEDAPSGYGSALNALDFERPDDPRRGAALDLVLSSARRRDALTLWHLLTRGSADERGRVYDRLAELVAPPPDVTREAVLAGDRRALDEWWDSLGLDNATWWKLWKKAQ
jgi:hypothetical protein